MPRSRRLTVVEIEAYDHVPEAVAARARIVAVPFVVPGSDAVTLGPVVFVRSDHLGSKPLLAHELVHVKQWSELGAVGFLRRYLGAYLKNLVRLRRHRAAYLAIPLEEEARREAAAWSWDHGDPSAMGPP